MNFYRGVSGWKALGFSSYEDYIKSEMWIEKRKIILEERGTKCEKCGSTYCINVHHLNYLNVGNESKEDVIVLCKSCHEKEHNGRT